MIPSLGFLRPSFDHCEDQVPTWCISMHTGNTHIHLKYSKQTQQAGRMSCTCNPMTEGSGSINVMNICHAGKQNDTICQISNFRMG